MRQVFLTFDDGPDPEFTPRILDALAAADMHATLFVIGTQARRYPELVRRAASEGHVIANHSFSHRHPWWMSPRRARHEVRAGAEVLGDVLGRAPTHYRPPHGRLRPCIRDEARACGQRVVLWNLSATDWGPLGQAALIAQRLARIQVDDIVLMHDGRNRHNRPDELLKVLPSLLAQIRQRGWRSVGLP
jgi:peptidoglycan/xylan/chitin deacetylase (PgdA/CDA1 family)